MNKVGGRVLVLLFLVTCCSTHGMESELVSTVQTKTHTFAQLLNNDFKKAVTCRDLSAAQDALKRGAHIGECNPLVLFFKSFSAGTKPIEMTKHDHAMVAWLVQNGAPVNPQEGSALFNPLVYALQKCALGCCVEALLKAGAKPTIDTVDFSEEPFVQQPLCWAIAAGSLDAVQLLCRYGASANCTAAKGRTPLHSVLDAKGITVEQKKSLIAVLIAQNADATALDDHGFCPLHEAIRRADTVAVVSLLEQGVSANTPTLLNESPLHLALEQYVEASKALQQEKMSACLRVIELLVQHKADVSERSLSGSTPLAVAVSRGSAPLLRTLLRGFGDGRLWQEQQELSLHLVLEVQLKSKLRVALIHELALAGVGFELVDALGYSPLTKAINKVDLASVEALLSHGADPRLADRVKRIPLDFAHRKAMTSKNQNARLIVERLQEYLDGRKQAQFKK